MKAGSDSGELLTDYRRYLVDRMARVTTYRAKVATSLTEEFGNPNIGTVQ